MKYDKLVNRIYKELARVSGDKPKRMGFSFQMIHKLFQEYKDIEVAQVHYCCCGDEFSCWTDVEGIDYGWMWLYRKKEDMPKYLYKYFCGLCEPYKKHLFARRSFLKTMRTKNGDALVIVLPLRDVAHYDIWLSFSNSGVGWVG